jgi:hypothetical protein
MSPRFESIDVSTMTTNSMNKNLAALPDSPNGHNQTKFTPLSHESSKYHKTLIVIEANTLPTFNLPYRIIVMLNQL